MRRAELRGRRRHRRLRQRPLDVRPGKAPRTTDLHLGVKANRIAPRRFGISATLSGGAQIDKSLSWLHVDERVKGRYAVNDGVARINLHHTVFTAKAAEVELTLDNRAAAPGEELGVNDVSVNPYFAREGTPTAVH